MRSRPAGLKWALRALVAAYVLALAAMPFAHHDLACHLKSSTHCLTCHIGTSADTGGADPHVGAADLVDAGRADEPACRLVTSVVLLHSAGRSPPPAAL